MTLYDIMKAQPTGIRLHHTCHWGPELGRDGAGLQELELYSLRLAGLFT